MTKHRLGGAGFYANLRWSPDSRKVAYTDNAQALYVLDLHGRHAEEGRRREGVRAGQLGDFRLVAGLALARVHGNTQALAMTVSAYSLEQDKSFPISDGLAEVSEPVFDRSGKYLYLFGSTDAGPVLDWFAQSTTDNRRTRNVYLVVLRNDLPSPLAQRERRGEAAAASRAGEADANRQTDATNRKRKPPSRCASISTASSTAFSICRFPPAISRTCRWARPVTSTTCARTPGRRRSRRARRRRRPRAAAPLRSRQAPGRAGARQRARLSHVGRREEAALRRRATRGRSWRCRRRSIRPTAGSRWPISR